LGSDGIYDKLSTKDVGEIVWLSKEIQKSSNVHQFCGNAVESIMKVSLARKSYDNITAVIIGFNSL
jgi:protein phosphatase 2C family protein 2/3